MTDKSSNRRDAMSDNRDDESIKQSPCRAPAPQLKEILKQYGAHHIRDCDALNKWKKLPCDCGFAALIEGTPEQAPACELELEQEADGRWLAAYTRFPGVAAYGPSKEEAIWNAAKVLIETDGRWLAGAKWLAESTSEQASPREFKPYMEDHEYYDPPQATPTPERCPDCGSQNRDFRRTMETDVVNGSNQRVNLERSYSPCSHPWHSSAGTPKAGRDENQ